MVKSKDFKNIGGLEEHIHCLKEMVILPLLYRDVYEKFEMKPPRGVLFHGPPGTGKTLLAGALAAECSNSGRKVTFFSRKGSDCLSKWIGESERKLRDLFEKAYKQRPAIIFFDEIDGLVPTRASHHDTVHLSIVTTLLSLMDGLGSSTDVIVIGATNRLHAVDPALRRPGRFDKELYFPLPDCKARKDILNVHMCSWATKPSKQFINELGYNTVGYCGSDLQALCSEAVMCCLKRWYPDIYTSKHRIHIDKNNLKVDESDFLDAKKKIMPSSHRMFLSPVKPLNPVLKPLFQNHLDTIISCLENSSPLKFIHSSEASVCQTSDTWCCQMLLTGTSGQGHTLHLAPAILHHLEHLPVQLLDISTLYDASFAQCAAPSCINILKNVVRSAPSILYLPEISGWWDLVDDTTKLIFNNFMERMDPSIPIFVLATTHELYSDMDNTLKQMFNEYQTHVVTMTNPSVEERKSFFDSLFLKRCYETTMDKKLPLSFMPDVIAEDDVNISLLRSGTKRKLGCVGPQCRKRRKCLLNDNSLCDSDQSQGIQLVRTNTVGQGKGRGGKNESLPVTSAIPCTYDINNGNQSLMAAVKMKQECGGQPLVDKNGSVGSLVRIDHKRLTKLLQKVVVATEDCAMTTLEALYRKLSITVWKYKATLDRRHLPQDLEKDIICFENYQKTN